MTSLLAKRCISSYDPRYCHSCIHYNEGHWGSNLWRCHFGRARNLNGTYLEHGAFSLMVEISRLELGLYAMLNRPWRGPSRVVRPINARYPNGTSLSWVEPTSTTALTAGSVVWVKYLVYFDFRKLTINEIYLSKAGYPMMHGPVGGTRDLDLQLDMG